MRRVTCCGVGRKEADAVAAHRHTHAHIHSDLHRHRRMHAHTNARAHTHARTHTCMQACTHARTHARTHTHTQVYTHIESITQESVCLTTGIPFYKFYIHCELARLRESSSSILPRQLP